MKSIGKPCAGKSHARFDEGGQAKVCPLLYPFPLLRVCTEFLRSRLVDGQPITVSVFPSALTADENSINTIMTGQFPPVELYLDRLVHQRALELCQQFVASPPRIISALRVVVCDYAFLG